MPGFRRAIQLLQELIQRYSVGFRYLVQRAEALKAAADAVRPAQAEYRGNCLTGSQSLGNCEIG